jgi:hypothetical protein
MNLDDHGNTHNNEPEIVHDVLKEFAQKFGGRDDITDEMFQIANNPKSPLRGEISYKIGCAQLDNSGTSWFQTSAEAGYPQGMYALARLCEAGMEGVIDGPDLLAAAYWYQLAEKNGHQKSIGKAEKLFNKVLESAMAGDASAMFEIGACHEMGIFDGAIKDIKIALHWYERAAALGSIPACRALFEIYFTGAYLVPKDGHKASIFHRMWMAGRKERKLDFRRTEDDIIYTLGDSLFGQKLSYDLLFLFENDGETLSDKLVDIIQVEAQKDDSSWDSKLLQALVAYRKNKILLEVESSLTEIIFEIGLYDIGSEDCPDAEIYLNFGLTGDHTRWGWPFGFFTERKFENRNAARCRRVESALREIAQQNVTVAKLLLGLILISNADAGSPDFSEGQAWLAETVGSNDLLGCLCYANLARSGRINSNSIEIKNSLKRVIYATTEDINALKEQKPRKYEVKNEIFSEDHFHILKQRAIDQLHVIELEEEAHQAKDQAQKDMLSYLTHTLNNTLSSGPESARQAMRILGSELYENNREYKAINNIASMFSTFLFAQQLLKTFKLYIAEPETLRLSWDADVEGDATIAVVLAVTLRQTLSQVVFASNHQAALQRLLPHKDAGAVKAIRRAFMDEIVPLDVDATNTGQVFEWVQDHLGLIHVNIDPALELHFRGNSTRYTFFFSSFSELVYNALKYSDGTQPIEITWGKAGEEAGTVFVFRCVNTWTEDSIQSSEGSGKGLVYLARLAEMLGASFEKRLDGHRFIAEIRFPEKLLRGQV